MERSFLDPARSAVFDGGTHRLLSWPSPTRDPATGEVRQIPDTQCMEYTYWPLKAPQCMQICHIHGVSGNGCVLFATKRNCTQSVCGTGTGLKLVPSSKDCVYTRIKTHKLLYLVNISK